MPAVKKNELMLPICVLRPKPSNNGIPNSAAVPAGSRLYRIAVRIKITAGMTTRTRNSLSIFLLNKPIEVLSPTVFIVELIVRLFDARLLTLSFDFDR